MSEEMLKEAEARAQAAENRAQEAETNMIRAAEYGKQILQQLTESEKLRTELEQEKHSLKLQLQNKEASENAMHDEVADLTKRCNELEGSQKSLKDSQRNLDECKDDFEKKEHEFLATIRDQKKQIENLEEKLESVTSLPQSPNVSLIDPSIVSDLKEEVEILKEQVAMMKDENGRLKTENDELNHLSHSLRLEINEKKAIIEEKEEELASYRESMRQANEEIKLLNIENDDEEPQVDVAPKGNSLFSEVEDRRHIAEEKLKRCQAKMEEFRTLHERKCLELNKLRVQNIHLMNMTNSSNGAKCEKSHVDRLQALLQAEKERNKDLMAKIGNQTNDADFVKNLMKQGLADSEKMSELANQSADLERQLSKLKSENFSLKMRLSDKDPSKGQRQVHPKESSTKEKFVKENITFETKKVEKSPEDSEKKDLNPLEALQDVSNVPKKKESGTESSSKKKVTFGAMEEDKMEEDTKPKMAEKRKLPRVRDDREIIDADEESKKMNEQCKQQ